MNCPLDTNGDGDCGQRLCPWCGQLGLFEKLADARAELAIAQQRFTALEQQIERALSSLGPRR